jgi:hypothetical protein
MLRKTTNLFCDCINLNPSSYGSGSGIARLNRPQSEASYKDGPVHKAKLQVARKTVPALRLLDEIVHNEHNEEANLERRPGSGIARRRSKRPHRTEMKLLKRRPRRFGFRDCSTKVKASIQNGVLDELHLFPSCRGETILARSPNPPNSNLAQTTDQFSPLEKHTLAPQESE